MNIGTSLKTISKNQLCSFIGTGGYVELAENDVLSNGSTVTAAATLPLLNSRNDKGDGILPPGYQKVEFLETSGTQYIDTGIVKSGEYLARFEYAAPAWYTGGIMFGWSYKHQDKLYEESFSFFSTLYLGRFAHYTAYSYILPVDFSATGYDGTARNVLETTSKANVVILNGETVQLSALGHTRSPGNPLNATIVVLRYASGGKVFSFTIFNESGLADIELTPVLDLNGTPCMYDKVSRKCFYNAGTGHFRVGIATLQQVRELQLPDNTGNATRVLYVSLPQEARTDFTAQKHLSDLTDLNWSINAQYRDGDIPADYTKVDFLESTGTQRIDINYQPTENTGYYTDFENTSTQPYQHVLSASADGAALVFTPHYNGGDYNFFAAVAYRDGTQRWNIADLELLSRKKVKFNYLNTHTCVINNQHEFDIPTDPLKEYQQATTCLFMYPTSAHQNEGLVGRLYAAEITEGESIAMDFIPVLNDTGAPGMYDKVGKQFYENSGTGDFIVGIKTLNDARMLNDVLPVVPSGSTYSITLSLPVEASTDAPAQKALQDLAARRWNITIQYRADEIPAGYAKVAFLESSGTQYIKTDYCPCWDSNLELVAAFAKNQGNAIIMSTVSQKAEEAGDVWKDAYFVTRYDNLAGWVGFGNTILNNTALRFNNTSKLTYRLNKSGCYADNIKLIDAAQPLNYRTIYPLFLFARNYAGATELLSAGRIYSFKAQEGLALKANLIPVINTAGVPGMYDKVSKKFFKNDGTGQFRVGLASKEAVCNLYLTSDVQEGTTIDLSVPAGTTEEDTKTLKANNPNYTFNIQYRS